MSELGLNYVGNNFQRQGNFAQAQRCYEEVLKSDPDYLPAMANLATILSLQNKLDQAEELLYKITERTPNDPEQWLALGNILMRQGKLTGCMEPLNNALRLRPENPDVHLNLAAAEHRRHNYREAERLLNHVLSLGNTHHSIYFDLAHVKLALGDLTEGLRLYEYRWNVVAHSPAWDHYIPEWQGEDLKSKHILVHAEQGFGDTIMLSRFISWLRAARITFAVPASMITLFEQQTLNANPVTVIDLENLPKNASKVYNFHTPMFSMLRWLGVTKRDISAKPYLRAPIYGPTVETLGRLNVGICWASGDQGDKSANRRRRVTDLSIWLPLADVPGVQLWSLQRDTGTSDIAKLGARGYVADVMPEVNSWSDTAKLISQLDLVISVDTGVVHLAGALGVPCWMLSQPSPCWRWWSITRKSGLPWYRDFRIFWRQNENWPALVMDCKLMLGAQADGLSPAGLNNLMSRLTRGVELWQRW